jgi:hypothetical protein
MSEQYEYKPLNGEECVQETEGLKQELKREELKREELKREELKREELKQGELKREELKQSKNPIQDVLYKNLYSKIIPTREDLEKNSSKYEEEEFVKQLQHIIKSNGKELLEKGIVNTLFYGSMLNMHSFYKFLYYKTEYRMYRNSVCMYGRTDDPLIWRIQIGFKDVIEKLDSQKQECSIM